MAGVPEECCPSLHTCPAPACHHCSLLCSLPPSRTGSSPPADTYHSAREQGQTRSQKRAQSPSLSSVPLQPLLLWGGCHRPTACPRPRKNVPKTCRGILGMRCPGIGHGSCCCISPGQRAAQHKREQIKIATLAL